MAKESKVHKLYLMRKRTRSERFGIRQNIVVKQFGYVPIRSSVLLKLCKLFFFVLIQSDGSVPFRHIVRRL